METRWRVPEGRSVEDTKVSERIKELHMSGERLDQIKAHLSRQERLQAEVEADQARVDKIRETSEAMTKDWKDSVQNQQAVRQAELEDMLTKQDDSNFIRFLSVRKEQEAERQVYVNEVRQVLLQRKDFPKAVGSAYLMSEVLHEREKQKEIAQVLKNHQGDVNRKEVNDMYEDIAKYNAETSETKKQLQEKNKTYADELMKQVEAIEKAQAFQREEKIKEELIDQERGRKEAQRIEDMRLRKLAEGRKMIWQSLNDFRDCQIKERERVKSETHNQEVMMKIMQKSKDRVQAMMKKKDREMQEARLARGLSTFDNSAQLRRDADLKLIYDRGLAKIKADEIERDEEQRKHDARIRQEIIDQHSIAKERGAANAKRQQEIKKWQMLNRFKCAEQEKQYTEELKRKALEQRAKLMKEHQEELAARDDSAKKNDAAELRAIIDRNERHDKEYMEYAKEVKELAQANGWPTVPIDKVIGKYKADVIGIKPPNRCDQAQKCTNKMHSMTVPGKRTHCPSSDPSAKCKHQKDRVLQ